MPGPVYMGQDIPGSRRHGGIEAARDPAFLSCMQGVRVISTPVNHYRTDGPVALRIEWKGLAITYSGASAYSFGCMW